MLAAGCIESFSSVEITVFSNGQQRALACAEKYKQTDVLGYMQNATLNGDEFVTDLKRKDKRW